MWEALIRRERRSDGGIEQEVGGERQCQHGEHHVSLAGSEQQGCQQDAGSRKSSTPVSVPISLTASMPFNVPIAGSRARASIELRLESGGTIAKTGIVMSVIHAGQADWPTTACSDPFGRIERDYRKRAVVLDPGNEVRFLVTAREFGLSPAEATRS